MTDLTRLDDLLSDTTFWLDVRRSFLERVRPTFTALYFAGVEGGLLALRHGKNAGKKDEATDTQNAEEFYLLAHDPAFAARAAMFITSYSDNWWRALDEATRREMYRIFAQAREEGWVLRQIEDAIAPLFSPERAARIAVTETTRLFGAGAQASYESHGIEMWEWRTAQDGLVDSVCSDMADGGPYPMSQWFIPAHVNCRCWPVPFVQVTESSKEAA